MADAERLLAAAQLVCAMFGMGAALTLADFLALVRDPRAVVTGIVVQLVAVPALAWGLGIALPVPAGVAAGLVLIASVPGGAMSNVFTYLVGGNVALSVALTGVTTLGALVTTPAILSLLLGPTIGGEVTIPVEHVTRDIVLTLLLPLGAGMLVGARLPAHRHAVSVWAVRLSLVWIAGLVILGGTSGRLDPRTYGAWGIAAIVLLALGAQTVAVVAARLARVTRADLLALAIEATIRNANLALMVQTSIAPFGSGHPLGDGMFFVALLYGGVAIPAACLPLVPRLLRRRG